MKIKLTTLTVAALFFSAGALAQPNSTFGYIPSQVSSLVSSIYELSLFNHSMGTARSAAMGGAFTSLGADLSSMNINPAGLGMYRRTSEIGVTASVFLNDTKNKFNDGSWAGSWTGTRTSAALNNIGFIMNGYEGTGSLTSLTVGVGYNQLADFNYRSTVDLEALPNAIGITKMFAFQLRGLSAADLRNPWDNLDIPFEEWGAQLGYKTGLLQAVPGQTNVYNVPGVDIDAATAQFSRTISRGSVGEYTFSTGMNFRNKLYFGFTFGLIDIYQNREVTYSESYYDNHPVGDDPADYMNYTQNTSVSGSGFNMKVGFVYRPIPELRIGAAVHSPTFVNIETRYNSSMYVEWGYDWAYADTPTQRFIDKYTTPTRILTGVSYTVAGRGLIAVDYEAIWYNGMRVWGDDYSTSKKDEIKENIKGQFAPGHTIRTGGELMVTPQFAVRAGYAYSQGAVRDASRPPIPVEKSSAAVSFGLGYRFGSDISLDLTYAYTAMKYTRYDMFLYDNPYEDGGYDDTGVNPEIVALAGFDLDRTRHSIMMSFNMRF